MYYKMSYYKLWLIKNRLVILFWEILVYSEKNCFSFVFYFLLTAVSHRGRVIFISSCGCRSLWLSSCDILYWINSTDILDDVFEGILSEFQPPHELNDVSVDHASGCSALPLVAAFSLHPYVFDCIRVSSGYRVHEVDLLIYSQISVADVTDGFIGSPNVRDCSRFRPD